MVVGERYGRLTTLREMAKRNHGHVMWECICDCGNTTYVQRDRLLNGHTRSCGCMKIKRDKPNIDITGQRFGRLVATEWVGSKKRGEYKTAVWKCRCDCGTVKEIARTDLMSGRVVSCGCRKLEYVTKHGGYKDRLYNIWSGMRDRCNNPHNRYYQDYGARGISICDEWNDYGVFKEWAYKNGYDESAVFQECTIDRIDVNGDYEPSNCRWVSILVQANNTRRTIKVEMDGEIKSVKQWCAFFNCKYGTALSRKNRGIDIREWFGVELPYKVVRLV